MPSCVEKNWLIDALERVVTISSKKLVITVDMSRKLKNRNSALWCQVLQIIMILQRIIYYRDVIWTILNNFTIISTRCVTRRRAGILVPTLGLGLKFPFFKHLRHKNVLFFHIYILTYFIYNFHIIVVLTTYKLHYIFLQKKRFRLGIKN